LEVKLLLLTAVVAAAQAPEATFQSRCATCHSAGNVMGAPLPETLRKMSAKAILTALETGRMKSIGATMTAAERETVAKIGVSETAVSVGKCTGTPRANGQWNGWADAANTRFAKASG